MQTHQVTGLIDEGIARKWLAHYHALITLGLKTKHPSAVEEAEEHVAMIVMAIDLMRKRGALVNHA